ncbi:DUF868 family protein, putative (DUF868) [Arabidopsis thaliana]|jgi:hypothetical protein|uniref:DUF868 family protein, putative (DUF868) n=1 Tax=Arabidopsis thaliana TaxID=3702 RepID=Q9SJQ8_ARATH|nr:DUF868 family protein, putative (DUF868) [Arabidopsis thaliana]AAD24631.1 expressed protein [Arabidopsis thaliana]AEC09258.1 DUF868 family protein, putative (DUF868) [Arabidopsis thaliana]|eukprot:NP_565847.1 DUF868 family protein, putative (DUF868) [Arabidopsis thaliana]
MRGLAACYSEHAIKVSDTYCSGPSNHSYISPTLPPSIPDTVTTTYRSNLPSSDKPVSVSLTWSDNLTVVISTPPKSYSVSLRKPKGSRKLTSSSGSLNAEILWDLSEAEYENNGPEPIRRFFVVVVVNSEITLGVGDVDHERDTSSSSSWRVSKTERFSGTCWLTTKAQFSDVGRKHEIQIQCGGGGGGGGEEGYLWKVKSPETMSVYVDKRKVFSVKKLKWNFRGNQTMFFDGMLIDMMWDLHDWFYKETLSSVSTSSSSKTASSSSSSSTSSSTPPCAVFMFRRRSGLDSRLWIDEDEQESEMKKNIGSRDEKHSFSLIICASKK